MNSFARKKEIYSSTHGYKPQSIPNSLKVLQGKYNQERMEVNMYKKEGVTSPVKNKIGGIFIPVRNIEKSKDWYCRLIGVQADGEIEPGHLYTLPIEGANVILDEMPMWGGNEPEGPPSYQTPAFMFQTDDIYSAYQYMKDMGAEIVTEIENDHWFAFRDPDGNLLMVCS